jgi:hypothetical protein
MVAGDNRETNLVTMVAVKANSEKRHLIVNAYYMLSNVEKEKLVIDLYYSQRKNVRQIAQEARISFRDIGIILKKKEAAVNGGNGNENGIVVVDNRQQQQSIDSNNNNKSPNENENATQAYELFSQGKHL